MSSSAAVAAASAMLFTLKGWRHAVHHVRDLSECASAYPTRSPASP